MRYILIILIASIAWAADPVPKLPADVQRVVDAREAEVAKAKAVYDQAVAKATAAAAKNMDVVIKAKMAKQDLEGAVAAKGVIEKWKSEEPDDGDLLGDNRVDLAKVLTKNKWILSTGFENVAISFQANGTTGSRVKEYSKWKLDGDLLSIIWDTDVVECQMKFDPKTDSFVQDDKLKVENRDKARVHALSVVAKP